MNCCGGKEQSSPPIPVLLLLMNGPGGWIVQSVLYLHQTVKPLPLLIICHKFTEHTLRPKGSPCPVGCPFPPLSGRPLSGQGARGRGPLSAETSPRPQLGLFPLGCLRNPCPKGSVPRSGGSPASEPGVSPPAAGGGAGCAPDSRDRASPSKFPARCLVAGDMRQEWGKLPVRLGQLEEKRLRRDPESSSSNRSFSCHWYFFRSQLNLPFPSRINISSRCIFQQ